MVQDDDGAVVGQRQAARFFLLGKHRFPGGAVGVGGDIEERMDGELFFVVGGDIHFDQIVAGAGAGYPSHVPDIAVLVENPIATDQFPSSFLSN